jgi:ABC-type multidrug transport system fused ATPase/permease subunit
LIQQGSCKGLWVFAKLRSFNIFQNHQHFAESIIGSTTIRSFGKENQFVSSNSHLMDAYSRPKFYNAGAIEWLCFHLDVLSSLIFAFSLIFLIICRQVSLTQVYHNISEQFFFESVDDSASLYLTLHPTFRYCWPCSHIWA